jgi:small subunit ribosomal protein S20
VANTRQAKKRILQSERNRKRNVNLRSKYRTYIKKVLSALTTNKGTEAKDSYKETVSVLDKMVTKGIIHKNKAARHKKRLAVKVKKLSTAKV